MQHPTWLTKWHLQMHQIDWYDYLYTGSVELIKKILWTPEADDLYSVPYNKHYPGNSSHLAKRLESHNVLGKEWTSRYRPWKLIYSKEFDDQSAAMQYEASLKTGVGRDFIRKLDL